MVDSTGLFSTADYLTEYYDELDEENEAILIFLHEIYRKLETELDLLELGGGPTIHTLISASEKLKSIVFSEYLENNREFVAAWKAGHKIGFDWDKYIEFVLELEDETPTPENILKRKEIIRKKIKAIVACDVTKINPLGNTVYEKKEFDIVSCWFVLESVSDGKNCFRECLHNVLTLLSPAGQLILGVVTGADYYKIKNNRLSLQNISVTEIEKELNDVGCKIVKSKEIPSEKKRGYESIYCLHAKQG